MCKFYLCAHDTVFARTYNSLQYTRSFVSTFLMTPPPRLSLLTAYDALAEHSMPSVPET